MATTVKRRGMDAYLAIISKREVRAYSDEQIPDDVLERILQAGRATGSAKNRQNWEFVVVRNRDVLDGAAATCSSPANLQRCRTAIAVVMHNNQRPEDGGRLMQNLMLAAWSLGVGTCPNTPMQREDCNRILGLPAEAHVATILSLGYPAEPVPRSSDPDAILARIDRKPLAELVRYVDE
jgi:nitroreductase